MYDFLRDALKKVFAFCGLDVRRRRSHYVDVFADQHYLLSLLKSDTQQLLILDVGANEGQTVEQYCRIFPGARIHCFEPTLDVFERLKKKYTTNDNIRVHQLAVSDLSGTAELYLHKDTLLNSLLPAHSFSPHWPELTRVETVSTNVRTITLDAFCLQHGIGHIDLLKFDIQGGELRALWGAHDLLEKEAIDLIFAEVLFGELYQGQGTFCDIVGYLSSFDFRLYGLYDLSRGHNGTLGWSNAIFLSPRANAALPMDFRAKGCTLSHCKQR